MDQAVPCSLVVSPCSNFQEDSMAVETYTGEAYCVKCKAKRNFTGDVNVSESGRRMAKGKCPTCNTTMCRILGKA